MGTLRKILEDLREDGRIKGKNYKAAYSTLPFLPHCSAEVRISYTPRREKAHY
jgi:hypothetical protein